MKNTWTLAALCAAALSGSSPATPTAAAHPVDVAVGADHDPGGPTHLPAEPAPSYQHLATEGVVLEGVLSGNAELPPNGSAGRGTIRGVLTGTPGRYSFTFDLVFTGVASELAGTHLHHAVSPPGAPPREQEGPIVFIPFDGHTPVRATWAFDTRPFRLTDALADALLDGEVYVNVHTADHPDGELRAQLEPVTGGPTPPTAPPHGPGGGNPPSPIPLPAAAWLGGAGLLLAGVAKRRWMRR